MKIYTFYTEKNEILYTDWFKKTFLDKDIEIIARKGDQGISNGVFREKGWFDITSQKVDFIIQAIEENWGEYFFFSDVDIQFFNTIKQYMPFIIGKDMVFQRDAPGKKYKICTGFFACIGNEKTLQFWKDVRGLIGTKKNSHTFSDQSASEYLLQKKKYNHLTYELFPGEFFNGRSLQKKFLHFRKNIIIPQNIVIHHANWTLGLNNKISQLKYVHSAIKKQKNTLASIYNEKEGIIEPCQREFGFEIANIIPHVFYLYTLGKIKQTHGLVGTKPFYYFSENHIEHPGTRKDSFDSAKFHRNFDTINEWSPPDYKDYYKNDIFIYKKPLLIIHNKYTKEWGKKPVNFINIKTLKKIISLAQKKYQIIYIRPINELEKRKYSFDNQPILPFDDYKELKESFPDVIILPELLEQYPEYTFNELQLRLMANSSHFISVQGGGSRLCSYFGGINIIYHKKGRELATKQYTSFFPKLSHSKIIVSSNYISLIYKIFRYYIW